MASTTAAQKRRRIHQTLALADRKLRAKDVNLIEIIGMTETPESPARITQDVLARRLGIERENVSRLVGRLANRGLLVTTRERQPDGRWGQLTYRLPIAWDAVERHTASTTNSSHGEGLENSADLGDSGHESSHGLRARIVTTCVHQGSTAAVVKVVATGLRRIKAVAPLSSSRRPKAGG